ncbi:MAG: class I SAM-dependent methyltransferase [Acidobacteriota bacterium]
MRAMNDAGSKRFKDYFSGHSALYARYRPTYPAALYEYCATLPARTALALDCATGSGQAARGLARHFGRVLGTDASPQQLIAAPPLSGVFLAVAPAERTPVADHRVDLVMVAQALHWLNHDAFYAEVRRLLAPGGALVATMYDFLECAPEIDAAVLELRAAVEPYWPPERAQTTKEGFYRIAFPLVEQASPPIAMVQQWTLEQMLGYLSTWSAVRRFVAANGVDPVAARVALFESAWGDPAAVRAVRWPLMVRIGRP